MRGSTLWRVAIWAACLASPALAQEKSAKEASKGGSLAESARVAGEYAQLAGMQGVVVQQAEAITVALPPSLSKQMSSVIASVNRYHAAALKGTGRQVSDFWSKRLVVVVFTERNQFASMSAGLKSAALIRLTEFPSWWGRTSRPWDCGWKRPTRVPACPPAWKSRWVRKWPPRCWRGRQGPKTPFRTGCLRLSAGRPVFRQRGRMAGLIWLKSVGMRSCTRGTSKSPPGTPNWRESRPNRRRPHLRIGSPLAPRLGKWEIWLNNLCPRKTRNGWNFLWPCKKPNYPGTRSLEAGVIGWPDGDDRNIVIRHCLVMLCVKNGPLLPLLLPFLMKRFENAE